MAKIKIKNAITGEVKEVDDSQLGDYGIGMAQQSQAPAPEASPSIGDSLINAFLGSTKKYLTEEPQKFIDAANKDRPKDILGGALHDFKALGMVLGDAVPPALELGSYAVGGASTKAAEGASAIQKILSNTVGKNAIGGALNAASRPDASIGDIATGAVGGGVGGLIGTGIGKVLGIGNRALGRAGEGLESAVINPKVPAGIFGPEEEQAIVNAAKQVPGASAADKYDNLQPAFNDLEKQISSKLTGKPVTTTNKALDAFNEQLDKFANFDESIPEYAKAKAKYTNQVLTAANSDGKNGLSITDTALRTFKKKLNDQTGKIFTKLDKGGDLKPAEEVALSMWKAADNLMPDSINELTRKESRLIAASKGLKEMADAKIQLPVVGKVPFALGPVQAGASTVGGALQTAAGAGNEVSGALNQVPGLKDILPRTGGIVGSRQGQGDQSPVEQGQSSIDNLQSMGILSGGATPTPTEERSINLGGKSLTESQFQQLQVADLVTGGKNKENLAALAKIAFPAEDKGKSLTEGDKKISQAVDVANMALNTLQGNKDINTGPLAGISSTIQETLGTQKDDVTKFKSQMTQAQSNFKTAMIGAGQTESEAKSLADALFNINLPKKILLQRLQTFIETNQNYVNKYTGGAGTIQENGTIAQ